MSTTQKQTVDPSEYRTGDDRHVRFTEDVLSLRVAATQRRILEAVQKNQRVLVVSGNGVGKSYIIACLILSFLFTNPDSTVLGTSGSYSQFVDTMWRPLRSLFKSAKEEFVIPGKVYYGNPPRLEIDDDWYAKVVSPRDPGDLEGRHDEHVLVIIEEADKRYIGEEHFDSAGSSITDANDRMVAVANPPVEETDVVYDLMRPESRWKVIQFSSFESHNVKVDTGDISQEPIPGLVDLPTIAEDWEAWNDEPWPRVHDSWAGVTAYKEAVEAGTLERAELVAMLKPGAEVAASAHLDREDLDERWYRRRAGVIPPESAAAYRPFSVSDVEGAYRRDGKSGPPAGLGLDVARDGGDWNALSVVKGNEIRLIDRWQGVDHNANESLVREYTEGMKDVRFAVDAIGEGSGLADRISTFHPRMIRFKSGEEAREGKKYYDRWTEGLYLLGKFLRNGGSIRDSKLREEMLATARHVELDEKYYSSRDDEVLKATPKRKVKKSIGRSPDRLDSALMAVWAATRPNKRQRLVW